MSDGRGRVIVDDGRVRKVVGLRVHPYVLQLIENDAAKFRRSMTFVVSEILEQHYNITDTESVVSE